MFRQRLAQLEGVAPDERPAGRGDAGAPSPAAGEEDGVLEIELPEELEFETIEEQTYNGLDVGPVEPPSEVAPFDPQERLAEANVFAKYGLVDKAIHQLEDILRYCPDHAVVRAKLVDLYLEGGQNALAREFAGPLLEHYESSGNLEALERLRSSLPAGEVGVETPFGEEPILLIDLEEEEATGFGWGEEPPEVIAAEDILFEVEEPPASKVPLGGPSAEAFPVGGEEPEIEVIELPLDLDEGPFAPEAAEPVLSFEPDAFDVVDVESTTVEVLELPPLSEAEGEVAEGAALELEPREVVEPAPATSAPAEIPVERPAVEEPLAPPVKPRPPSRPPSTRAASALADLERSLLGTPPARPSQRPATRATGPAAADLVDSVLRDLPSLPAPRAPRPTPPADIVAGPAAPATPAEAPVPPATPPAEVVEEVEVLEEELVEITERLAGPAVSALSQVDFFIEQELYEDAIRMLDGLQREFPDDPEVAERRALLKAKGLLLDEGAVATEGAEELFADEEELLRPRQGARGGARPRGGDGRGGDRPGQGRGRCWRRSSESSRRGSRSSCPRRTPTPTSTSASHTRRWGLLPEAIREFQVSSRDPAYYVESCSMIGVCYIEQGMADQATEWYRKAMDAPGPEPRGPARAALRPRLGAGDGRRPHRALAPCSRRWQQLTPHYRDVSERLEPPRPAAPGELTHPAAAVQIGGRRHLRRGAPSVAPAVTRNPRDARQAIGSRICLSFVAPGGRGTPRPYGRARRRARGLAGTRSADSYRWRVTPTRGQRSSRGQPVQRGEVGWQRFWPKVTSRSLIGHPQVARAAPLQRELGRVPGSRSATSPRRLEMRWTWVSTQIAGTPKPSPSTRLAVLRPTPGSASSALLVGRHPARRGSLEDARRWPAAGGPWCGRSRPGRSPAAISSSGSAASSAGVGASSSRRRLATSVTSSLVRSEMTQETSRAYGDRLACSTSARVVGRQVARNGLEAAARARERWLRSRPAPPSSRAHA